MMPKENFPIVFQVQAASAPGVALSNRALYIEGLVLLLPQSSAFRVEQRLTRALHMCVNLKELGST